MPPTKKLTTKKTPSSGSDPKSRAKVKSMMHDVMHEFKEGELRSGKSTQKVKNPKQAIAIGLSEARRSGARIPPAPAKNKSADQKATKKAAKN